MAMRRAVPSRTDSGRPSISLPAPKLHCSGRPRSSVIDWISRPLVSRITSGALGCAAMSSVAVPPTRLAAKSSARSSATWVTRAISGRAKLWMSRASAVVRIGATEVCARCSGAAVVQAARRPAARAAAAVAVNNLRKAELQFFFLPPASRWRPRGPESGDGSFGGEAERHAGGDVGRIMGAARNLDEGERRRRRRGGRCIFGKFAGKGAGGGRGTGGVARGKAGLLLRLVFAGRG